MTATSNARRKPANLIYDVDEKPGLATLILLGFEHICVLSIAFVFPVLVIQAIGGKIDDARHLINMAMIATGIATVVQGLNRGPIGSGYLCPLVNGPAFLSASILAGKAGGLPLIFGMTFVGGLFEAAFSRVASRMRALFPAEVTGTIVTMVGIEVIPHGLKRFFGIDADGQLLDPRAAFVGVSTLALMMGLTVWGKGKARLYSVLIGMVAGYIIAALMGFIGPDQRRQMTEAPWFALPVPGNYGMSFSWALVVPFVVASLSSALKTMGDLTTCQKINDANWKRPDMPSIGRGILACASGNILSGLAGALGTSPSSSNVGLSIASGATSRTIAYSTGAILILLAFLPKCAAVFVIMPSPVMGASLAFAASFMVMAGIQIMMSRLIDSRKTFVIGTSIVFGLSVDLVPGLYHGLPQWIAAFFQSSLSMATVCAIVLNVFMRIGIARTARIQLVPGTDGSDAVFTFMQRQGSLWGAMPDVIAHAASDINEVFESTTASSLVDGPLQVAVSFDEFNLDVDISYKGRAMPFPNTSPSGEEMLASPDSIARMSGFIVRKRTDRVESDEKGGIARIRLHYIH